MYIMQISTMLICKSFYDSLALRGKNYWMYLLIPIELLVIIILVYTPVISDTIGLAPLTMMHFGFPALPFFFLNIALDELRKMLVRIPA